MTALLAVTLALWFAGWMVLGRVRLCGGGEADQFARAGQLSLIIPARNEAGNIEAAFQRIPPIVKELSI